MSKTSVTAQIGFPAAALDRNVDTSALLVAMATLFNMALCFFFTLGLPVASAAIVAGCEVIISTIALMLARDVIGDKALLVMAMLTGYLLALSMLRQGSDPKIIRDLMIPFAYYFLGLAKGTPDRADRLVRLLLIIVLVVGVVEWLNIDLYTRMLNVTRYFVAKGMMKVSEADNSVTGAGFGLYISGMRIEGRNFLPFLGPFLGLHRVSSVFLEPIELSNFAVIAYIWLLCRFKAHAILNSLVYMLMVFILITLCDSRFASLVCVIITLCHFARISSWAPFVAVSPIIMCGVTLIRACLWRPVVVGDDLMGRLYTSGSLLASFTPAEWFGLTESQGPIGDAGYAYLVTYSGFLVPAILWIVFVAGSGTTRLARTVRGAIAIYSTVLLTVSYGLLSIKTAALLWYLYGTVASEKAENSDV